MTPSLKALASLWRWFIQALKDLADRYRAAERAVWLSSFQVHDMPSTAEAMAVARSHERALQRYNY